MQKLQKKTPEKVKNKYTKTSCI